MAVRSGDTSHDRRVRVQGVPVDSFPRLAPEVERGAVRRITVVGEEILRRRCQEVTRFGTPELSRLIDDMFATNQVAEGAGLAANQVDVDLRLFVWDITDEWGCAMSGTSPIPSWTGCRPDTASWSRSPKGACPFPARTEWCPDSTVPSYGAATRTANHW